MEFTEKTLECIDCMQPFVFTADEQRFFFEKQFTNIPKRCKACRAKRKPGKTARVSQESKATCAVCFRETTLPFKPTQGRPVLCRECFQKEPKAQPASSKQKTPQGLASASLPTK